MSTRKLFRPSLAELKKTKKREPSESSPSAAGSGPEPARRRESASAEPTRRKAVPPDTTFAEYFYLVKQMQGKTGVVVVLTDGEELHGWIEWYDKDCIKVNRHHEPNVMLYKHCIKYIYKDSERRSPSRS